MKKLKYLWRSVFNVAFILILYKLFGFEIALLITLGVMGVDLDYIREERKVED
nr:MAG TPA: hypothetical protein [Caudoviricetes sp.]